MKHAGTPNHAVIAVFSAAAFLVHVRAAVSSDAGSMKRVDEKVKPPDQHGMVLQGSAMEKIDCPNVFNHGGKWFMIFAASDGRGYENRLAVCTDLFDMIQYSMT